MQDKNRNILQIKEHSDFFRQGKGTGQTTAQIAQESAMWMTGSIG
jgi:hypothetical protein